MYICCKRTDMHFFPAFEELRIRPVQIYRAMGYRDAEPDAYTADVVCSLTEKAKQRIYPRIYVKTAQGKIQGDLLQIGDTGFHPGDTILQQFRSASQYYLFIETAGPEYEAWKNEAEIASDPLQQYIADALGTCVVEGCTRYLLRQITRQLPKGWGKTLPLSPGHCEWDTGEQRQLFSLFSSVEIPVSLTDSCLMQPVKSASGIIGTGEGLKKTPVPCEICTKTDCFRRIL